MFIKSALPQISIFSPIRRSKENNGSQVNIHHQDCKQSIHKRSERLSSMTETANCGRGLRIMYHKSRKLLLQRKRKEHLFLLMNGYKGDKIVLDPFEIKNGDLVLDFPSCLVKPRRDMTPAEKSKAKSTIQILHLNDEDQANRRLEIVMEYICGNISRAFLESKYPFIAEELDRQNLYDRIREIIKIPASI